MKLSMVLIFSILVTSVSHAGCLQTVKNLLEVANEIKTNKITLLTDKSIILKPGEEGLAFGGEFFNNTKEDVEVFFLSEPDGYGTRLFSGLLLNRKSCKKVALQSLGDSDSL